MCCLGQVSKLAFSFLLLQLPVVTDAKTAAPAWDPVYANVRTIRRANSVRRRFANRHAKTAPRAHMETRASANRTLRERDATTSKSEKTLEMAIPP